MSRIDIDFSGRQRLPGPATALLFAALALALAFGAYRYTGQEAELRRMQGQIDDLVARRASLRGDVPRDARPEWSPEKLRAVSAAVSSLNVRWPALLEALERSKPAKASLLRIEPRPKERALLLSVQTPDVDTLVDFMDTLSATAPFRRATPLVQESVPEGMGPVFRGSFLAYWQDQNDQQDQELAP